MLTRLLAAAVVALLFVVPVEAAYTSQEATSVQNVMWAAYGNRAGDAGSLHDGIAAQLGIVTRDRTTATTRPLIASIWQLTVQAQNELALAISDLTGAPLAPLGQVRSYYVQRAIGKINNVQTNILPALLVACDKAIAAGANGAYPATLDRFKSIAVAGATAKLKLFNRALAYADPYPVGRSIDGRITIIGPHGDYLKAAQWMAEAFHRLNLMYGAAIAGYNSDALLPTYTNKYQQLKFASLLTQKAGVIVGTYAGLQFTGYSSDPFFRVLGVLEKALLHGGGGPVTVANDCGPDDRCHAASYDFNNIISIWTFADQPYWSGRPAFMAQSIEVIKQAAIAWQAFDTGGAWNALVFPECVKTGGCGGQ